MGQTINPKAIRFAGKLSPHNDKKTGSFANIWFSDFKYSSLFYQHFYIKKNQITILMKYYKTRVRFIKGRNRRLKSLLRINRFSCLFLPYKKILLCCIHRPAVEGLQRKHAAFIYKKNKKAPSVFKYFYKAQSKFKSVSLRESLYSLKSSDSYSNSRFIRSGIATGIANVTTVPQCSRYLKRFQFLVKLLWINSIKKDKLVAIK